MYYMHPIHYRPGRSQRKGMVLLIVIAMLALFASVALAFVFYAESAATGSQVTNGALTRTVPDGDPELLLTFFLSQLNYDSPNYNSVLRGHSLMRTMYGSNPNNPGNPYNTFNPANPTGLNFTAFGGIGRLHYGQPSLGGDDDYFYPNTQYYPSDGFMRDPEIYGARLNPLAPLGPYRAGNAPYTYPDANNMFLAQVSANGEVIVNSFHRPWLLQHVLSLPAAQQQQNMKYAIMFPDNLYYHNGLDSKGNVLLNSLGQPLGAFNPVGADQGGHVRNLDFSLGFKLPGGGYANNDSYWLDLGYPVMIAPNGRKYKALFAPLVIDLDNRINMWLAGNLGKPSNRGYGPNEINPATVITNPVELLKLYSMRYGAAGAPTYAAPPIQWPQRDGPISSRIDFDGLNGGPLTLPNPNNPVYAAAPYTGPQFFIWPDYPNGTYQVPPAKAGNPPPWGTPPWFTNLTPPQTVPPELINHPLGYNVFLPTASGNNPIPAASNMEAILRFMGTGAPAASSVLFKNMPTTFGGNPPNPYQITRARGLLTTHSWNLDRVTGSPYIPYSLTANTNYQYTFNPATQAYPYPQMPPLTSPSFAPGAANGPVIPGSEFTSNFRSTLAHRVRVNVNRISSGQFDYPTPDITGFIDMTVAANAAQFNAAQSARIALAQDIYTVLVLVTGAQDPNLVANAGVLATSPNYQAARWLAQLAVNIVDYIDNDDICTPFQWYTPPMGSANAPEIVFGTEAPRLVLNEAYAELDNFANDFAGNNDASKWTAANYSVNVWAELYNPFKISGETYPLDGGVARLNVTPSNAMVNPYAAYQLQLAQFDANLRTPGNNFGQTTVPMGLPVTNWGPTPVVTPANGTFYGTLNANVGGNNGFFVVGPQAGWLGATPIGATGMNTPANNPNLPSTFLSQQMSYTYQIGGAGDVTVPILTNGTTLLLQRLACPYLPPGPTNPYITVDYVQNVKTWDNRIANPTVNVNALPTGPTFAWTSVGRRQPYYASRLMAQQPYTTVSAASNGMASSQAVINVVSTFGFPPTGNINVNIGGNNVLINYTGTTATSFTGCTGGNNAQNLATGQVVTPASPQPRNTFFRHNSAINYPPANGDPTLDVPFDWLVQLDRPVVNSLELMHVSGVRPHELTQQFITFNAAAATPTMKFQHYAPWTDHAAMIFRALELLGVPSNLSGTAMGSRVPGKININTMNEIEVFLALCDPNAVSNYSAADVQLIFNNLLQSRTPAGVPGPADAPFRSLATGWIPSTSNDPQYPSGAGLRDTVLRKVTTQTAAGPVTQPLFMVPPVGSASPPVTHPYLQSQLLQKIFNNVSTTSNVFAIWLTVGFFEVQDTDAAGNPIQPPKIGSEIGRDQNMQIRHRMFAIVDRSAASLFTTTGVTNGDGATATVNVPPNLLNGTQLPSGMLWTVQKGMMLEVGLPGTNAFEVVAVSNVAQNANGSYTITAKFTLPWAKGTTVPIVCRGNPGPYMTNASPMTSLYNHRTDPAVLYYSVIQ